MLLDGRFLIGGLSKDIRARRSHTWSAILTMDAGKQEGFIERILFLHEILNRRGSKVVSRLSMQDWAAECDRICLLHTIYAGMKNAVDADGNKLFNEELVTSIGERCVEGLLVEAIGTYVLFFSFKLIWPNVLFF